MSKPHLAIFRIWLQFESTDGSEMMHKTGSSIGEVPHCFSRSSIKFQGHTGQNLPILTQIGGFGSLTHGFEMMHKARYSIEEGPYCFSRSSIKFQGHMGWEINNLNPIWVRLLGQSQLSKPSDLSRLFSSCKFNKITIKNSAKMLYIFSKVSLQPVVTHHVFITHAPVQSTDLGDEIGIFYGWND